MPELCEVSDQELVAAHACGSPEALAELFDRYRPALSTWVGGYVRGSEEIADILQDTFLDVLRGIGDYDPSRPFGPWMRAVCRHRLYKYFRAVSVRRTRSQRLVDEALLEDTAAAADAAAGQRRELLACLRCCLDRTGPEHRALIAARYGEGASYTQLAARFGKRANTLATTVGRLRAALRRCIQQQVEEPPAGMYGVIQQRRGDHRSAISGDRRTI